MIFLVQNGTEIARLAFRGPGLWMAQTLDWGQCWSDLDDHMRHLSKQFPLATFVFVS